MTQSTAKDFWGEYPWFAARALWVRWAPELFSLPVFIKQHLPLDLFDGDPVTPEDGQRHWQAARAVMDLVAPPGGHGRPDLFGELREAAGLKPGGDIESWLRHLVLSLARLGMVDEAVEICTRMATACDAEDFLGKRAVILAEAGRREEALQQVEANLKQFPEDVWVRMKAGDVYKQLGDLATAEATYRHAIGMADGEGDLYDRDEAVARLVELLYEAGRAAEVDALREAEDARYRERIRLLAPEGLREQLSEVPGDASRETDVEVEETATADQEEAAAEALRPSASPPAIVRREGPKVGRNDPCPCGSGQKFKRCCGR